MIEVQPEVLTDFTRDVFVAAGAERGVATRLARSLVMANLSGHDSHGVIRISQYVREIQEGELDPKQSPSIIKEGPTWALVDGKFGFGHEAARYSMGLAIARAKQHAVGMATAVRCNHIGRLGEWVEDAAAEGLLGIATVALAQPSSQLVAPYGGSSRVLGTNPIAIGAPRQDAPPLLLDFATSASAEGKVRVARDKGSQLPPNTIVDRDGNPSTDPNALYAGGALLPAGAHKGYALAMMVEVLSLALGGADEPEMAGPTGDLSGSFFLAIDPTVFRVFGDYSRSIDRLTERVTAVKPAPGFQEVLLPGDPEYRTRAERAESIPLPEATVGAITRAAASFGIPPMKL